MIVSLQLGGESIVSQDGRDARLQAGQFALYDSERPYRLQMSAGTQLLCLQFPRRELQSRLGALAPFVARPVACDRGVGGLFAGLAKSLPDRLNEIGPSDAGCAGDNVLDLVALALGNSRAAAVDVSSPKAMALARLKRVIRQRLCDPDFNPAAAAARANMSVRHANRLLAAEGTSVERLIFASRLDRCRAALADPAWDRRSISEIAFAHGFNDVSHFSRAFRAHFGCAARDFRRTRGGPD